MIPLLLISLLTSLCLAADRVLVSVYPFYDVVREIGHLRYGVDVLIPPRADYHLYELTPKDLIRLARAEILFVSGVPLGGWEEKAARLFRGKVVSLTRGMDLLSGGRDPHIWLSPKAMMRVARNAFEGFASADPEGRAVYERGLHTVLKRLEELDSRYRKVLQKCRYRLLPVVHPALGYLARDYNLRQISVSRTDAHEEFLPSQLSGLLKEFKIRNISFVFTVKGHRSKLADILQREYGFKTYELNVKILPTEEAADYFSVMRRNLSVLREALQCM